ncbi:MAG: 3-phosphoshikimate 1-carboxyvinyltransferase [Dethiobacter sp.]|jgi:3-phosphoshikimate 1-carboxyvinyltransferase|nr:MAG: 3-phosphoshikimate 1-carboxyvinyltransferase [Dethiobacter sp.]
MDITVEPREQLLGQTRVPGDKSISHRALILSSLVEGTVELEGLLEAGDPLSTYKCLQGLGVEFYGDWNRLKVKGKGLRGLREPEDVLNAENSGTTARLLLGVLAGQPFFSTLTGDTSLRNRPMGRVTEPLKKMGAYLDGRHNSTLLPLYVRGGDLTPIRYTLPVASAQVKSALLLAALYTSGTTEIIEPVCSRDHTERMLCYLGSGMKREKERVILETPFKLKARRIQIPGDISSASFFLVAAALAPRGELLIEEVGINPTRTGILDVLEEMGAGVKILNKREYNFEPVADLFIKSGASLKGIEINSKIIPRLVDEIPVIAVAALFAEGETVIKGAGELRFKETDRLSALTLELRKMGAVIKELPDGLIIKGKVRIKGSCCSSHGDHRIAMALAVAALFARGETVIQEIEPVQVSFPGFFELLQNLTA